LVLWSCKFIHIDLNIQMFILFGMCQYYLHYWRSFVFELPAVCKLCKYLVTV